MKKILNLFLIIFFFSLFSENISAEKSNKIGTNIVLDLGANVECGEKNLIDFSLMGSALYKSLFNDTAKVALLNIGS